MCIVEIMLKKIHMQKEHTSMGVPTPEAIKSKCRIIHNYFLYSLLVERMCYLNSVYAKNQIKGWQTMAHGPNSAIASFSK